MKKIFVFLTVFVLLISFAMSAGPEDTSGRVGQSETDKENAGMQVQEGIETHTQEMQQTGTQASSAGEATQQRAMIQAGNIEQLRTMVQNQQQTMNQEMQNMNVQEQKIYQNQNRVRIAVHAFLAMENLSGGIGKNVSAIAKGFNNSIRATIKLEELISNRNKIKRFFAGGDHKAATQLENVITYNKEMIEELKQLKENCKCNDDIKTIMQEQIENMEKEQIRLGELAQNEIKSKGMFGWIWKRG